MNQATGCGATIDLYDMIIEIDHNTRPRVAGRGSAVFIHVARRGSRRPPAASRCDQRDLKTLLEPHQVERLEYRIQS